MKGLDRATKTLAALNLLMVIVTTSIGAWALRVESDARSADASGSTVSVPSTARSGLSLDAAEARPVFSESRRPAAIQETAKEAEVPPPSQPPVFVGALRDSTGRQCAFFEGKAGKKMVCAGADFDGWTVMEIKSKAATVRLGSQVVEVPLSFESRGAAPASTSETPGVIK